MKIDLDDLPKDSIEKAATLRDLNLGKFFFFGLFFSVFSSYILFSISPNLASRLPRSKTFRLNERKKETSLGAGQ